MATAEITYLAATNKGAPARPTRAYMLAIAAKPREGRVRRAVRRALIAAGGRPLMTRDVLAWAYPRLERFKCWHYKSVYRAAPRYAVKRGRVWMPRS
jgi:hypothetical protein